MNVNVCLFKYCQNINQYILHNIQCTMISLLCLPLFLKTWMSWYNIEKYIEIMTNNNSNQNSNQIQIQNQNQNQNKNKNNNNNNKHHYETQQSNCYYQTHDETHNLTIIKFESNMDNNTSHKQKHKQKTNTYHKSCILRQSFFGELLACNYALFWCFCFGFYVFMFFFCFVLFCLSVFFVLLHFSKMKCVNKHSNKKNEKKKKK